MSDQISKIYELRTLGYDQVKQDLDNISASFRDVAAAKREAQNAARQSATTSKAESDALKKSKEEVAALKVEEQKLRVERQQLMNESKALNLARQQEIAQLREQKKNTDAAAGSYDALYKQYKQLYALVKAAPNGTAINFRGEILQFDQAIAKLQQLAAAEQDFRRQFSRDSLLVGEYTSGIVQAFKQMGLDDLVGGQIQKANERLQMLNNEFGELQKELTEVKVKGDGSFENIERQLIENRKEAIALGQQVGNLKKEFQGVGDVGNQITGAISKGFQNLKTQASQFALGFIGISAAFSKLQNEVSEGLKDARQVEGVEAAFRRLNDPALLDNLREATRGTVSDLELMKAAVQASNFQIPLETLGDLLEFARRRAKDTGQEVDYLVQSIITGIGRKSPLILDNLGISAVRLKDNLKGLSAESATVGDVASAVSKIIVEENAKAGEEIATATEKLQQQESAWINIRTAIARGLLPVISAVGAFFLFLLTNLPTIGALLGAFAVGWLATARAVTIAGQATTITNAQILLLNIQIAAGRAAQLLYNAAILAGTIVQRAYTAGLLLLTGATRAAQVATTLLGGAMRLLPLGIILTAIGLLAAAFKAFSATLSNTTAELRAMAIAKEITAEISKRVADATTDEVSKIQLLTKVARDNSISMEARKKAIEDLIKLNPDYLKGLSLENIRTEEGIGIINRYVAALREKAAFEAAQAVRSEKLQRDTRLQLLQIGLETRISSGQAKDLEDLTPEEKEFIGNARKNFAFTASVSDLLTGTSAAEEALNSIKLERSKLVQELDITDKIITQRFANINSGVTGNFSKAVEVDIKALQEKVKSLNESISEFQGSQAELNKLIAARDAAQKQLDKLLGKKESGSTAGTKKDPFEIDLKKLDTQLKAEATQLENDRDQKVISEEDYLRQLFDLNDEYFDEKLLLYLKYKPKEIEAINEVKAERLKNEIETNKALFDIQSKALEQQLKNEKDAAAEIRDAILNDPASTETQRAQAKVTADTAMLQAQQVFNNSMNTLERQYNQVSIDNANQRAKAIREINASLATDNADVLKAQLADVQQKSKDSIAAYQRSFSELRLGIQTSSLTTAQKNTRNKKLTEAEQRGVLSYEVSSLQEQLPILKRLLDSKLITQEQYYNAEKDLADKSAELNRLTTAYLKGSEKEITTVAGAIKSALSNLFKFDSGNADLDKLLAETIAQSFNLAKTAMDGYYDAERQRIEQSKQANLERLDLERQQLLARAQSRDEELAIEKQFQAKKDAEDRKAFEKNKKIQRAQAAINLATQLSNLAVIAFAPNPANIATLGTAGAILYAVQAALAIAGYFSNIKRINSATYEFGGSPDMPDRGGKIGGKRHKDGGTPFMYKGRQYEAEVDELAIIRTKNAPKGKQFSISGTWTQIASKLNQLGGGVSFAPGAKASQFEYGGTLGESLQAPVFVASTTGGGASTSVLEEIKAAINQQSEAMARNTEAVNRRIDRLQVYQVTSTVTKAQDKEARQAQIGNL